MLRIAMAFHAFVSAAYWIAQPRGFAPFTRSFIEHQVVAPTLFAVSAAGFASILLKRVSLTWLTVGILAGFWTASAAVIVITGSTGVARLFWGVLPTAAGLLLIAWRLGGPAAQGLLTGGTVAGWLLAAAFWSCSCAPVASTQPQGGTLDPIPVTPGVSTIEKEGIRVSVLGHRVIVESGTRSAVLWPGFDYFAVSDNGTWSLFDFRSTTTPGWTCGRSEQGGLVLTAANRDFQSSLNIWIGNRSVHVRNETRVEKDLAAHLSSVLQLNFKGIASVEGIPWRWGNSDAQSEFIAFRHGRTEFLRAAAGEKGPFETLGSWALGDPVLSIDGWTFQLLGWAQQGSREPSPTAGWGVSQACIERSGSTYYWALATTSVGRGWHTVRTAKGVYSLEAVITPP